LAFFDDLDGAKAWPVGADGRHPLRDLLMDDFLILDLSHAFAPAVSRVERAWPRSGRHRGWPLAR
jgi:hypothetical protein